MFQFYTPWKIQKDFWRFHGIKKLINDLKRVNHEYHGDDICGHQIILAGHLVTLSEISTLLWPHHNIWTFSYQHILVATHFKRSTSFLLFAWLTDAE